MTIPSDTMFGRWTVISREPNRYDRQAQYLCRCACGTERVVGAQRLRNGLSKSCGCLKRENVSRAAHLHITHGEAGYLRLTSEYRAWTKIIDRCTNPETSSYRYYGARGVKVYEGWLHNYPAFLAYIGRRPSSRHSIDRYPNNQGNYEPGNVRWATQSQQMRNMRRNVFITKDGRTATIAEWAEITGLKAGTIQWRHSAGWPVERILALRCT